MNTYQQCRAAYKQGQQAAECGWERISPYQKIKAEGFWYAGYDGVDYNTYVNSLKSGEQTHAATSR
jgi:hypothetical protein